jgi:hypothetical protein
MASQTSSYEHPPSYDELILSRGQSLQFNSSGEEVSVRRMSCTAPYLAFAADGSVATMEHAAPTAALSIVDALITPAFSPALARVRTLPAKPTFSGWMRTHARTFPYMLQTKSVI